MAVTVKTSLPPPSPTGEQKGARDVSSLVFPVFWSSQVLHLLRLLLLTSTFPWTAASPGTQLLHLIELTIDTKGKKKVLNIRESMEPHILPACLENTVNITMQNVGPT